MRNVGTTTILRTSCSAPPSVTPSSCPRTVVLVCRGTMSQQVQCVISKTRMKTPQRDIQGHCKWAAGAAGRCRSFRSTRA